MTEVTLSGVTSSLAAEGAVVLDLAEMADDPGGAWPAGWYRAAIIEGYATRKGKQFTTGDEVSKNGESRNLRLCFNVKRGKDERTMQETYNYRSSDFGSERIEYVKQLRVENSGVKNWADKDAQRTSMAIAKIGQIGKATAKGVVVLNGNIVGSAYVGTTVDVRLSLDENGYNVVTALAPAGEKTRSAAA